MAFVWAGPRQWLVTSDVFKNDALTTELRRITGNLASVSDQSDGRALLRLSGSRVRDFLAKGLPIDLHPREFRKGHVAMSAIAHINVHIWQVDDEPTYELALSRSYAHSFWEWLVASSSCELIASSIEAAA